MRVTRQRLVICSVALAVLAFPGFTWAEGPPTEKAPTATKAYYSPMVIPAAAFINDGVDIDGFDFRTGGIEGLGDTVHMMAPVYLPDGAKVSSFRAYVYDNTDSCGTQPNVDIFLYRTSWVDGHDDTVAITISSAASTFVQFTPVHTLNSTYATINNSSYMYWIDMRICSLSHRLNAVVIEF